MKKLPIGIQSFKKLRTNNYLYVDKTEQIYNIIKDSNCCFLSRPRRFGKSLLCSTLQEIFAGNKKLFQGLWIEKSDYDWKKHPVIPINFSTIPSKTPKILEAALLRWLKNIAHKHTLCNIEGTTPEEYIVYLLENLAQNNKVVLLIDEYDKPILDHIQNPQIAHEMRNVLRNFYSTIKNLDEYLEFVFITGVSKFSKTSIFSGLNNLDDLTTTHMAATLLGYTQEELETNFEKHILELAQQEKTTKEKTLEKIKEWYNGYCFFPNSPTVYNPFSSLSLFKHKHFKNYWFETGTPTFLIDLIEKKDYSIQNYEGIWISEQILGSSDIAALPLETILFQTGYLTIANYDKENDVYQLQYPNNEVIKSFFRHIAYRASQVESSYVENYFIKISDALRINNFDKCLDYIKQFLQLIPYTVQIKKEKYYQSMFYIILKFLGAKVKAEIPTPIGRIDATIENKTNIYIIEFKINKSAQTALKQIEEKKYYEQYLSKNKIISLVGINFIINGKKVDMSWQIKPVPYAFANPAFAAASKEQ